MKRAMRNFLTKENRRSV